MQHLNWKIGLALSLMTALMWGALPVSIAPVIGPVDLYTITFYRLGGGGVLLLAWILYKKGSNVRANFRLGNLPYLLLAVLGLSANYYFWLIGLDHTSPATAQVMIQLAPMLLLIGSVWLFKEAFNQKQLIGVIVFVLGLLLFFNEKLIEMFKQLNTYSIGILYLLIAAVTWAIFGLAQKKLLQDFGALELIFVVLMLSCMIFMPLASPEQAFSLSHFELGLLIFGGVNTAVAYGCFTAALQFWETPRVSAVIAIVPVLTLSFGFLQQTFMPDLLPPEPINQLSILGAMIVVIGSSIAALSKKAPPKVLY
jgi:drug/metabolite transporter (DMT)-like permease